MALRSARRAAVRRVPRSFSRLWCCVARMAALFVATRPPAVRYCMSSPIWFALTARQRDALMTLESFPAAWLTFDRFTWQALRTKALVTFTPKPRLTDAGHACVGLARVLCGLAHMNGRGL